VSEQDRSPEARIVVRPIGSPLTIGMSGLAIASLVQSGLDLQWIALDQTRDVGLILIAVPFVLQIIACVFSYLARDGATGAAIGVLAASWLALGLVHTVCARLPERRAGTDAPGRGRKPRSVGGGRRARQAAAGHGLHARRDAFHRRRHV
jgi:hypothetical protein